MSFKNLEARFNEKVNDLYAAGKYKFDGGRASTGRNDDPLMVRRPGDGRLGIKQEGRSIPFNSSPRDVIRLTSFSLSPRGLIFLAKQQLLQTGNTFEQTRLINPIFAVGNAVPFLHIRRHLRPITGGPGGSLLGKTDVSYNNVRKIGQLQKSTYDGLTSNAGGIGGFLKKLAGPITSTISAFTAKKNVGEDFGYDEEGWKKTRPELGKQAKDYAVSFNAPNYKFGGTIKTENFQGSRFGAIPARIGDWDGNYTTYLKTSDQEKIPIVSRGSTDYLENSSRAKPSAAEQGTTTPTVRTDVISETGQREPTRGFVGELNTQTQQFLEDTDKFFADFGGGDEASVPFSLLGFASPVLIPISSQPFLKYFTGDDESIKSRSQGELNARDLAAPAREDKRRISYIRDPSNISEDVPATDLLSLYSFLPKEFEDAITVSFAMGNNAHVQFRSFITDLNQSASPEYKVNQYIGRIEKFISYTTVQRTVSFKLQLLAFSKDELSTVWTRLNYLNAFVFPYGFDRGILQPNIIKMTIGNVYADQPCYITQLDIDFNELTESWDIDAEVPIAATVNITAAIIEKDTKWANKPFFGIVENLTEPPEAPAAITPNEPELVIPEL